MARGVNKVILVGTLGRDPELRRSNNSAVTNISIATSESWKNKQGEKQESTEWHNVVFFGKLAEVAGEWLNKGMLVYIEGKLKTEKYTDKQGVEKYTTKIYASDMKMMGGGSNNAKDQSNNQADNFNDSDDLPF